MSSRWWWSFVAVLVLAGCERPAPAPEAVRAVRTIVVDTGTAQGSQAFAAEVRARTETRLAFRVGGKLLQRRVELGQAVRAGALLAELDPQDLRLGQAAAESAVQAASVAAAQAQADHQRFKELHAQGFISAAELQRRDSALRSAQAQLDQARAQSAVQGNQAGYSRLLAPTAGVVTAVEAEPGMVLAAGQPVLRLAHDGPRDVVFHVPEDLVGGVRALIGRDGALAVQRWGSDTPMPARVREVAAAADPVTRTFLVKADLGDARVDLGQTATVTLAQPPRAGVVRLPLAALWQQQGRSAVWLLDTKAMTVRAQAVEVVGADGEQALIGAGLSPGMEVVTAGAHVLTEGQPVVRFKPPTAADVASNAAPR